MGSKAPANNTLPILSFHNAHEWRAWLHENHDKQPGLWMRFFKKGSGKTMLTYPDSIDDALCYGWIDSQVKSYDEISYIQKFTPRREKSIWSKINTERVERLVKEGKMMPAGMQQVEQAKKDGRWQAAYDSPKTMTLPQEFLLELEKHPKAKSFFLTLSKTNSYAIAWRLQTAKKPETKERRIKTIVEMLEKGEKFH